MFAAYLLIASEWVKEEEECPMWNERRNSSNFFCISHEWNFCLCFYFHSVLTSPDYNTWLMQHKFFDIKYFFARNKLRFFVFAAIFFQFDVRQKYLVCRLARFTSVSVLWKMENGKAGGRKLKVFCEGKLNFTIIIVMQEKPQFEEPIRLQIPIWYYPDLLNGILQIPNYT